MIFGLAALIIHFGFLSEYINFIFHEDSGPYVAEAERLLLGLPTADGGLPGRGMGYPLFLATVISLISPNLIYVVVLQHLLSISSAFLLSFSLRMLGVGRLLSYGLFIALAFSHRLIHYDNMIGAETLSVFLISVIVFVCCGMLLRRWNPWVCTPIIAVLLAYTLLVRSAIFFIPPLITLWILLPGTYVGGASWRRRLAISLPILLLPVLTATSVILWNKQHYGRAMLSREAEPVMAFAIGYSGDFTGGSYMDIKRELAKRIMEGRAERTDVGYYNEKIGNNYQWVYRIFHVISVERLGSQEKKDKVVKTLFWETMLTPKTLFHHIVTHVLPELRFMLFDVTPVTNSVSPPSGFLGMIKRDSKTLKIAKVRWDYAQGSLLAKIVPGPIGRVLQRFTNHYIRVNYQTEYKKKPGVIQFYSTIALIFLLVILYQRGFLPLWKRYRSKQVKHAEGTVPSPPEYAAITISLIWLGNAVLLCTLLYALHRYTYYVIPYLACSAFYGLHYLSTPLRSRFTWP